MAAAAPAIEVEVVPDPRDTTAAKILRAVAKTPLNIALIGYGFMGRTHTNAFLQTPRFFDVPYQPVLKAIHCFRRRSRKEVRARDETFASSPRFGCDG